MITSGDEAPAQPGRGGSRRRRREKGKVAGHRILNVLVSWVTLSVGRDVLCPQVRVLGCDVETWRGGRLLGWAARREAG